MQKEEEGKLRENAVKKVGKSRLAQSVQSGLIGLACGFFGGGGGLLCVPLLGSMGESVKVSHATTLLIMLPVSVASAVVYCLFGKFQPETNFPVTVGVLIGGAVGALLLSKLPERLTSVAFAVITLVVGLKTVL